MTDDELNLAVVRSLGWDYKTLPTGDILVLNTQIAPPIVPLCADWVCVDWATSLDACFRDLVHEARSYQLSLQCLWDGDDNDQSWTARFTDQYCQNLSATDPSPPRALCLAWLKTKA